ncbi:oxidoreductase [Pedobacter yulinensis]|uniref:Probable oxidoreductase n=1 Tax=Pedobacter yulinensis TaxID=2126353 RepID=A0A2T3HN09_9SPHI|nr:SDR family NAD(P)-dependent oxidoreductase [Pedobacter yulinensis]PST83834.1 oxidoreductase [Pedobacter yulinensis]
MKRILSTYSAATRADEIVQGMDLSGKRCIVTGAGSGIGVEIARVLASAGASVTLAVRNIRAGNTVAESIRMQTRNRSVHAAELDLNSRKSVQSFCKKWKGPLHILINNAGIMALPHLTLSPEGWEMQFATNYLGHFALAWGLQEALADAASARIVTVSSSANLLSPVVFDDLHFAFRPYDPWLAYAQSKTANILFAVASSIWWEGLGITSNALNPGAVATGLPRHIGGQLHAPIEPLKTVEQAAATSVFLAVSPLVEGVGGRYFENCNEAITVAQRPDNYIGVAPYALDQQNAMRLWDETLYLLK